MKCKVYIVEFVFMSYYFVKSCERNKGWKYVVKIGFIKLKLN